MLQQTATFTPKKADSCTRASRSQEDPTSQGCQVHRGRLAYQDRQESRGSRAPLALRASPAHKGPQDRRDRRGRQDPRALLERPERAAQRERRATPDHPARKDRRDPPAGPAQRVPRGHKVRRGHQDQCSYHPSQYHD
jgi:hypothetical protein